MSGVPTCSGQKELVAQIVPIVYKWCQEYEWDEKEIESLIHSFGDIFSIDYTGESGAFCQITLPHGANCKFPLDFYSPDKSTLNAYVVAREGSLPTKISEGDEIFVPTYKFGNAISINGDYLRDKRKDVIRRSLSIFLKGFKHRAEFDKYRCLLYAAKNRVKKPLNNIKALVTDFASRGKSLTHIVISSKAMELMKKESDAGSLAKYPKLSEVTDSTIPILSGINEVYGIKIIVVPDISDMYYDMLPWIKNKKRWYKKLSHWFFKKLGFQRIKRDIMLGLDLNNNSSTVQPIREKLITFNDPTLARSAKVGIYGWMEHGIAILDSEITSLAYFPFSR